MVMCRNLMFVTLKQNGSRIPICVLEDILKSAIYNNDGFGIYVKFMKREFLVRTLSLFEYTRALVRLENENIILLHTHLRAATSGLISIENVHLWSLNGIMFSHNGYVSKYTANACSTVKIRLFRKKIIEKKNENKEINKDSDSKQFFFNNSDKIAQYLLESNIKGLKEICKNEGLYGVVMINDRNGNFTALGLGKPLYLYVLKKNKALIVSNTSMYISNANEIKCESVRGQAGEPKFYYKKWKEGKIIEIYKNNWYWYDWYT
ncbi:MAG: hypothetical protein QXT86_13820 [Archaeoglobaceae archaeon]